MGRGIGMWLLYRAGDGGLAFSALVVPPGIQTPVHDHLAWGLVGLYRGDQDEDVFVRTDLNHALARGFEPNQQWTFREDFLTNGKMQMQLCY